MVNDIDKWTTWINRIEYQVKILMMYRAFNADYVAIVNANSSLSPNNHYLSYFRAIYHDGATMAIRRQAKSHRDSVSLQRLMREIAEKPKLISRTWTRSFYRQPLPSGNIYDDERAQFLADNTYKRFADESGEYLDVGLIEKDLETLKSRTASVVQLADRAIAHDDCGGVKLHAPLTFNDLDAAIITLEEITRKYIVLLTGRSFSSLTPIDQANSRSVFIYHGLKDEIRMVKNSYPVSHACCVHQPFRFRIQILFLGIS
jgi:hypothetical protein